MCPVDASVSLLSHGEFGSHLPWSVVPEEHVRLRRVVRLHDHVLRTAVGPFTMQMCAPSSGSRCPTPSLLSCG